MLLRICDLVGTHAKIPFTHGSDDLERRIECRDGCLEAHLIVTLARATVGDAGGAVLMGRLDEVLRDQRAGKRGEQGVLVLIHGVRGNGAGDVVGGELLRHIDHLDGDAPEHPRFFRDLLEAVVLLAHIAQHGDDVEVHLVLQPFDAHGGIQASGVREHDLFLGLLVVHGLILSRCLDAVEMG